MRFLYNGIIYKILLLSSIKNSKNTKINIYNNISNKAYNYKSENISKIYIDYNRLQYIGDEKFINLGGYKIKFDKQYHELTFNLECMNKIFSIKPKVSSLGIFEPYTTRKNFNIYYVVIDDDLIKTGEFLNYNDFQRRKKYIKDVYLENKLIMRGWSANYKLNDINCSVPYDGIYLRLYEDTKNNLKGNQKWGTLHIPREFISKYLFPSDKGDITAKALLIGVTLSEGIFGNNTEEHMFILNKSFAYVRNYLKKKLILQNSSYTELNQIMGNSNKLDNETLSKLHLDRFNNTEYSLEKNIIRQINNNDISVIEKNRCWLFYKISFTLIENYIGKIKENKKLKIEYYIIRNKKMNNDDIFHAIEKEAEVKEFCDTEKKSIYYYIENGSIKLYITHEFIDLYLSGNEGRVIFFFIEFTDKNNTKTQCLSFLNGIFKNDPHNNHKNVIIENFCYSASFIDKFIEKHVRREQEKINLKCTSKNSTNSNNNKTESPKSMDDLDRKNEANDGDKGKGFFINPLKIILMLICMTIMVYAAIFFAYYIN